MCFCGSFIEYCWYCNAERNQHRTKFTNFGSSRKDNRRKNELTKGKKTDILLQKIKDYKEKKTSSLTPLERITLILESLSEGGLVCLMTLNYFFFSKYICCGSTFFKLSASICMAKILLYFLP